jgi:hypothetical protein
MRATCHAQLIILDLNCRIESGYEYKL